MIPRLTSALAALALAVCCVGCAAEPAPAPSATGFASEEEAFAAAEETYRAYVDALNHRRADPNALPSPTDFLVSDALSVDISTKNEMEREGLTIVGETHIVEMTRIDDQQESSTIWLAVCLDSSATAVVNSRGDDVTPDDRPTLTAVDVHFAHTPDALVISSSTTRTVGHCSD